MIETLLLDTVMASKGVFFQDNNEASYEKERMISNKRCKNNKSMKRTKGWCKVEL